MQEEIEKKTVNLAIQTTKVGAKDLYKLARFAMRRMKEKKQEKKAEAVRGPKGKQSVKELISRGDGVKTVEIADEGFRDLKKLAKKYGVDFAVVKEKNMDPPRYTFFFKAKDADAIEHMMGEYTKKQRNLDKIGKAKERPSVLKKLAYFKEIVAKTPRKEHEKTKEQTR